MRPPIYSLFFYYKTYLKQVGSKNRDKFSKVVGRGATAAGCLVFLVRYCSVLTCLQVINLHLSFCSREFNLVSLFFLIGLKWASTCINCKKLMESPFPSWKKACTIRSPRGLMASSGIRSKSSRLKVPQLPLSRLVKRLYRRSIWLGVTENYNHIKATNFSYST
jgi:hypothetical protein